MQPPTSPAAPPEPETAEDALMSLMMALGRRLRSKHPGDVVDFSAFPLLKLLGHQGPMRLSAVAGVLGLDASTISRHVRQLEERGLLERTDDPDDRRASRVAVSPGGSDALAEGMKVRRQVIRQALDAWSDEEREQLRTQLHRLVGDLLAQQAADSRPDPTDSPSDRTQETSA